MRSDILFYMFVAIFSITAIITLLGVVNKITIRDGFLKLLFTSLLLEVISGVIVLYRTEVLKPIADSEVTVRKFYENIQNRNYQDAYKSIDEKSNFRSIVSFENFEDGYKNTIGVNLLAVAPVVNSERDSSHEYIVYYYDEFNMPTTPSLNNISSTRVKNLTKIIESLNEIKMQAKINGLNETVIDELTFQQLVSVSSQAKIVWLLKRDSKINNVDDQISQIFHENKVIKEIRAYKLTLRNNDGTWYIQRFSELQ